MINRRSISALAAPLLALGAAAAVGVAPASANPPPNYTTSTSTGAAIIPGTTELSTHCDDCTASVALPFPVTFYGTQYSGPVKVSSNGNIQFTGDNDSLDTNCPMPEVGDNATSLTDTFFLFYDDLLTNSTGAGIWTGTTGVAPHRKFVVEWRNAGYFESSGTTNFEAVFTEGSPTLTAIYGASADSGAGEVSGVQLGDGSSEFKQFSCHQNTLVSGLKVLYTIPEPLTVTKSGTGTGTVTSSPSGVDCGSTCSASYPSSTVVTLTATAAQGSNFTGWGGACSGTGTCQVTMDSAQAVSAAFTLAPVPSPPPSPSPSPKPSATAAVLPALPHAGNPGAGSGALNLIGAIGVLVVLAGAGLAWRGRRV
jgi:hypothetical protein